MREVLGDIFEQKQVPQQLRYGSDCSGADAPMWALHQIISDLKDRDRGRRPGVYTVSDLLSIKII